MGENRENSQHYFPVNVRHSSWDKAMTLCEPITPEAVGEIVRALCEARDENIAEITVYVRKRLITG